MEDAFLNEDNYILVIPSSASKPTKVIYEDAYKIETTDDPHIFTLSTKMTVGEVASRMNMSIDEFLEWIITV